MTGTRMGSENATDSQKGAALAVQRSLVRLREIPTSNGHFTKMEKQTQFPERDQVSRRLRLALCWGLVIVLVPALISGGLAGLSMLYLKHLRGEIVQLAERKELLEADCDRIWRQFKGLEPYSAEGKDYLLTPPGWRIMHAGTLEQTRQDAWQIVRK